MKKSEIYHRAAVAVMRYPAIESDDAIEVIAQLLDDRRLALWAEEEEEKNGRAMKEVAK